MRYLSLIELGRGCDSRINGFDSISNADSRWWALRTLAQSPLCRTEWLVPFLSNDPAPEVRQCAALGLGDKPDESAIQPLVQALSDEDHLVGSLAGMRWSKLEKQLSRPLLKL